MGKSADEMRNPEEIQAEIRRTEEDMTATIETIQRRLSPSHLKEQATEKAREIAWKIFGRIKEVAVNNPVPVLLGGVAAMTVFFKMKRGKKRPAETAATGAGHLAAMAGENPETVSGAGRETRLTAAGKPLMAVGLGVALGVLVAAVIPLTRRENELMGKTRDDLLNKAKGAAQEAAQTVRRFTGGTASSHAGETTA